LTSEGVLAVIPARFQSSRFPGKPLALIRGVPMIVRVMNRARSIGGVSEVIVATDHTGILETVREAGGEAVMTSESHSSGTSRISEAASGLDYDIILNIQGDEPLLPVRGVEDLIREMTEDRSVEMATLASFSGSGDELGSPDTVKVVFGANHNALYFSRAPLRCSENGFYRHIGIYGFRKQFLMEFVRLPAGDLEKVERLEQLRALENGFRIRVVTCDSRAAGVDRPEDIKRVEKMIDKN